MELLLTYEIDSRANGHDTYTDEYFLKQSGVQSNRRLLLMILLCYSHLRSEQTALSQPCTGKRQNVVKKEKLLSKNKLLYTSLSIEISFLVSKSRF